MLLSPVCATAWERGSTSQSRLVRLCTSHRAHACLLLFAAGGAPITSYRLEMCCLGGVEGGRGEGGKGKAKVDPPFELAYLGPERIAGGWGHGGVAGAGAQASLVPQKAKAGMHGRPCSGTVDRG